MKTTDRDVFLASAARTLFLSAWADWCDETHPRATGGKEIDAIAPQSTPLEATIAARKLYDAMRARVSVARLFEEWQAAGGHGTQSYTALQRFAHCCAMEAIGHGVGLIDDVEAGTTFPELPAIDFTMFDLPDAVLTLPGQE